MEVHYQTEIKIKQNIITMKMIRKITLFITLFAISLSYGQSSISWSWTVANGSTGQDDVKDFALDNAGNAVVVGKFGGPITFGGANPITIAPHGIYDMYIAKVSAAGSVLWVKTPYGPNQDFATAVEVDKQGNSYVLADFYDSLVYDSSASGLSVFMSNPGLSNIYLAKYSPAGNLLWAKNLGGISIDYSKDLALDTAGNVYVTGGFYKTIYLNPLVSNADTLRSKGQQDIFIAKYTSNGNFVWCKQLGSSGFESSSSIKCTQNGGFVMGGTYYDSLDFNPSPVDTLILPVSTFGANLFITKYDNNGNYVWTNGISSAGFKSVGEIALDKNENVFITGKFNDVTDFDTQFAHNTLVALPGNSSIFFGKYNANNGSLSWMKKIEHGYQGGQDEGTAIALDAKEDIYITGKFWGQGCDFNTSLTDTFLLGSYASNNYDLFIAKYNNTGDFRWAYNLGDAQEEVGEKICFDHTGSMYLAATIDNGSMSGPIDFDFDPNHSFYYQPLGGYGDFSLSKYSNCAIDDAAVSTTSGLTAVTNGLQQYQWVNCGVGYAPISGATAQTYLPTNTGTYACILTSSSTCKDTTACLYFDVCVNFNNTVSVSSNAVLTSSVANASSYQWMTCETNGTYTPIAGANAQSFTPTQNGSYACKAVKGTCVDTSACKQVSNVGFIEYAEDASMRFYPNPAKNVLNIEASKVNQLSIVDMLGHEFSNLTLNRNAVTSINIETLPTGVYFIKCKFDDGRIVTKKFIKQ
jgi:hypothetical protein